MDVPTVITALVSSGVISLGVARWLTKRFVDHRLAKDLKDYETVLAEKIARSKGEIDERLNSTKASLEAQLRQGVEEYLGDKEADRLYRLDARKRLYAAIGPLRFQLVVACADFAARIVRIGTGKQPYSTSLNGYFGRSTAFRMLRVISTTELIERQMAYADFSVDASTVSLLQFKRAAFMCLSSSTVSLDHPKANWDEEVEHIVYDGLSMIAASMITADGEGTPSRVMRFDEFDESVSNPKWRALIQPVPKLFDDVTITEKPVLWIRLVAMGELCSAYVKRDGSLLGIRPEPYDGMKLLNASEDEFVKKNGDLYRQMLERLRGIGPATSGSDEGIEPNPGNRA